LRPQENYLVPSNTLDRPLILDGGMGHLLKRNGVEVTGRIGTMERFRHVARANRDSPGLVVRSHLEYIRAGAQVITTNTYACVPSAFDDDASVVVDLIRAGGECAQEARAIARDEELASAETILIAGSLPPLHETYRANRVADYDELSSGYRLILEAVAPYSDVLLCETMHSAKEACAAAEAASASGLPIWVSFTVSDDESGTLRSGESMATGLEAISNFENVEAVLVNCSSPQAVTAALRELQSVVGHTLRTGAYANGFSREFAGSTNQPGEVPVASYYDDELIPEKYAELVTEWRQGGSSIVGGCCGVFPEHIAAVSQGIR
jgi:S-methylmethionine-dependent homocysteine/selenocysteine methylase